ncbi:hypothetical protein Hanom_Chr10g00876771 [Helianthus anomalus]
MIQSSARVWFANVIIIIIGKGSNKNNINVRNVRIEGKNKKWRCHFGNYEQLPNNWRKSKKCNFDNYPTRPKLLYLNIYKITIQKLKITLLQ